MQKTTASRRRDTNFKLLVLDEIQAGGDSMSTMQSFRLLSRNLKLSWLAAKRLRCKRVVLLDYL
jgi:hypothetical protein